MTGTCACVLIDQRLHCRGRSPRGSAVHDVLPAVHCVAPSALGRAMHSVHTIAFRHRRWRAVDAALGRVSRPPASFADCGRIRPLFALQSATPAVLQEAPLALWQPPHAQESAGCDDTRRTVRCCRFAAAVGHSPRGPSATHLAPEMHATYLADAQGSQHCRISIRRSPSLISTKQHLMRIFSLQDLLIRMFRFIH